MEISDARVSEAFRDLPSAPLMRMIPTGSFTMGAQLGEDGLDDERPAHLVRLDKPFSVGVFPITFEEWDQFAEETDAHRPESAGSGRGRYPVAGVSWTDANSYFSWLAEKTGQRYRLLSEAEWEYRARAGIRDGCNCVKPQPRPIPGSRDCHSRGLRSAKRLWPIRYARLSMAMGRRPISFRLRRGT